MVVDYSARGPARVRSWLAKVGVRTLFIEPGSPWKTGYVESFNGELRDGLPDREIFYTLLEAEVLIELWREHYNQIRRHSSLRCRPPAPEAIALVGLEAGCAPPAADLAFGGCRTNIEGDVIDGGGSHGDLPGSVFLIRMVGHLCFAVYSEGRWMIGEVERSWQQKRPTLSSARALIRSCFAQYRAGISVLASIFLCVLLSSCQRHLHFQLREVTSSSDSGARRCYDSTKDGQADFFTFADSSGRISRIGYDNDADAGPDVIVNLDDIPSARCRHLVLIVDGFGYDLVKRYYDSGQLRMFHPPSRIIAPYPSVTEVSLSAVMGSSPCRAIQSRYFDRKTNSLIGGVMDYIRGRNEPFAASLTYRAERHVDGLGYLLGMPVFVSELNTVKQLYDKRETRELIAYLVSTSAVSVRAGATGQIECLEQLDRFITEVLWQSRGLVKVTMLADHGLSYEKAEHLDLEKHLTDRGWLMNNRLDGPRDVVLNTLGVVTYACFSTRRPAALSEDLITCKGVELVSYALKDAVEVLSSNGGRAVVRVRHRRFLYETLTGDPLLLKPILESLETDEYGSYDPDDLLKATGTHIYPTPLQRLWEAHFCRVENPPDVIVSLQDRYCSGPTSFAGMVPILSTHGSLNYRNSVTFLMSTVGTFPPVLRSGDIRKQMGLLLDNPWPMRE